jgi:hypothetical protein
MHVTALSGAPIVNKRLSMMSVAIVGHQLSQKYRLKSYESATINHYIHRIENSSAELKTAK